ncbi:hypothetical protein HAX54_004124 [Datura stramonium]|uniref:FRIGIDA-like protein n=1 Tax=Datura stramonium TaxID=4076 RepID=A0ABS8WSN1_DATST|nr:hypothetical protein [Datura stramonium]
MANKCVNIPYITNAIQENDQKVHIEAVILIACIMSGIHVNFEEVVEALIKRKARRPALSMTFPQEEENSIMGRPKSSLGHETESAPLEKDLGDPTPIISEHAFEEVRPPRSSPPPPPSGPSGLQKLANITYANDN